MKSPYHQLTGTTLLLAPMVLLVIFCNKKWDEPSGFTGPQISVTMTIKELVNCMRQEVLSKLLPNRSLQEL